MNARLRAVRPASLRDLPIFWKLLLPFLVLLLIVGSAGAYIIVRDLTSKSAAALSEQLTLRAVEARSLVHDRELDLLESANYASNLQGMADAIARARSASVSGLLQSVLALKTELDLAAATNDRAISISEFVRKGQDASPTAGAGTDWSTFEPVQRALAGGDTNKTVGFVQLADGPLMIMVSPICRGAPPCSRVGFAIVGLDANRMVQQVASSATGSGRVEQQVTVYDEMGKTLASTAEPPPPPSRVLGKTEIQQRRTQTKGREIASAYTGFTLGGNPAGTIAVTIPSKTAFGSVGPAALRLVALVVLAMALAVAVGAVVARLILRQLRTLVETSRQLGKGKLSARAPVLSEDEHGELAAALNRMAEQVEASHESLELQVEQRTEEIRRLLQDRTEFFAGLSHELRTPLAIIITQADRLLAQDRRRAKAEEVGDTIRASASQLLDLVNDILDLARAEAGSIDVKLEPVRLQDLVPELSSMLVRLGSASGIEVKFNLSGQLPVVAADPARLRDVVINLVDNAIKYTPDGGTIEISASQEDSEVRISVADTGVGIPPEVGDRVFEPFYRVTTTSPQHNQASSGLGLALTRRWVEAQGGTIRWAPRADGGTVFEFTLPIDRSDAEPQARGRVASRSRRSGNGTSVGESQNENGTKSHIQLRRVTIRS